MPDSKPSLNPLAIFEKLITEHGSAVIQEKHIAFLREQLTLLVAERDRLLQESAVLAEKSAELIAENQNLREQVEKYEIAEAKAHQTRQEQDGADRDRTDEEYAILAAIVKRGPIAAFAIGNELGYMRGERREYITHLLNGLKPLVWESAEYHWSLTERGRAHLYKRGKL